MMEGALALAGNTSRRLGAGRTAASFPFVVESSATGHGSVGRRHHTGRGMVAAVVSASTVRRSEVPTQRRPSRGRSHPRSVGLDLRSSSRRVGSGPGHPIVREVRIPGTTRTKLHCNAGRSVRGARSASRRHRTRSRVERLARFFSICLPDEKRGSKDRATTAVPIRTATHRVSYLRLLQLRRRRSACQYPGGARQCRTGTCCRGHET